MDSSKIIYLFLHCCLFVFSQYFNISCGYRWTCVYFGNYSVRSIIFRCIMLCVVSFPPTFPASGLTRSEPRRGHETVQFPPLSGYAIGQTSGQAIPDTSSKYFRARHEAPPSYTYAQVSAQTWRFLSAARVRLLTHKGANLWYIADGAIIMCAGCTM